jgi:hypothetical protein
MSLRGLVASIRGQASYPIACGISSIRGNLLRIS